MCVSIHVRAIKQKTIQSVRTRQHKARYTCFGDVAGYCYCTTLHAAYFAIIPCHDITIIYRPKNTTLRTYLRTHNFNKRHQWRSLKTFGWSWVRHLLQTAKRFMTCEMFLHSRSRQPDQDQEDQDHHAHLSTHNRLNLFFTSSAFAKRLKIIMIATDATICIQDSLKKESEQKQWHPTRILLKCVTRHSLTDDRTFEWDLTQFIHQNKSVNSIRN